MSPAKKPLRVVVEADGALSFIYTDELRPLVDLGHAATCRVSNVEPDGDGWSAQMVDGPKLGPFRLRSEALDAEVAYLEARLFT